MSDDVRTLAEVVRAVGTALRHEAQRLCDLDAAVGDGDHGLTMVRCWELVEREAGGGDAPSLADALERAGRAVILSGGGATGPLLGTSLIAAGRADSAETDPPVRAARMLGTAADEVERRGRAREGDRTLLDALRPAAAAARRAVADGGGLVGVVSAAADAAEAGAELTAGLIARVGRAVRIGERAIGYPDPGAVSVAIILRAAADRLEALASGDARPS